MMDTRKKTRIGLFGLAYHAALAAVLLGAGAVKGAEVGQEVYAIVLPCLLVASFTVYFFAASSYVGRRKGLRGLVLYSIVASLDAFAAGGLGAYLQAFGMSVILHLLWAFASFMMQILVLGNLAGLIGWYVLKKADRS